MDTELSRLNLTPSSNNNRFTSRSEGGMHSRWGTTALTKCTRTEKRTRTLGCCRTRYRPKTLYLIPFTLNPLPFTMYPAPYTLYPIPYTLYPMPCTLYPMPYILYPMPCTLNLEEGARPHPHGQPAHAILPHGHDRGLIRG